MQALRITLLAVVLAATACSPTDAQLRFDSGVPSDVRQLAAETWDRFAATFPDRMTCIPDVTLVGAWELEEKATYDPDTSTILLRIPGTTGQLETALVHEFGHHLDLQCTAQASVRPAFMAAQDIDTAVDWSSGPTGAAWEDVPAEQFAEATILAVLDYRLANRHVPISPEAVDLIKRWGRGEDPPTT